MHAIESGGDRLLVDQFTDAGAPHWGAMHVALGRLPGSKYWYKAIALACMLGATACIDWILRQDRRLTAGDAGARRDSGGGLSGVFAVARADHAALRYLLLAVLRGSGLLSKTFTARHSGPAWARRGGRFWEFRSPSNRSACCSTACRMVLAGVACRIVADRLARLAPALCLPPAVFFGKRWLFPMRNAYSGYNRVSLSISSLLRGLEDFVKLAICGIPSKTWRSSPSMKPLFFLSLIIPGLAIKAVCRQVAPRGEGDRRSSRTMLAAAAMLFFCGAFAYVAVGKPPVLNSYESRHALLIGLPLAIGCLAVLRMIVASPMVISRRDRGLPSGGRFRSANEVVRSLAESLYQVASDHRESPRPEKRAPPGAIVLLDDQAPFGMPEKWRQIRSQLDAQAALGDERRMGFDARRFPADARKPLPGRRKGRYFGCRDAMVDSEHLDEAPSTRLEGRGGTDLSDAEIYLGYWMASDRAAYVKGLVRLEACANGRRDAYAVSEAQPGNDLAGADRQLPHFRGDV